MKKYRTSAMCPRCGKELYTSDVLGYSFVCELCDENFYTIEIKNCSADFWNNITQEANQLWKIIIPATIKDWKGKLPKWRELAEKYNCDFLGYDDIVNLIEIGWANSFPESDSLNELIKDIEELMK